MYDKKTAYTLTNLPQPDELTTILKLKLRNDKNLHKEAFFAK